MGVYLPIDLTSKIPAEGLFQSNAALLELQRVENQLARLAPPSWPEDVFGRIDRDKAKAGKALFMEHCASCHNAWPYRWTEANKYGKRFILVGLVPQTYVGTDRAQFDAPTPTQAIWRSRRVLLNGKAYGTGGGRTVNADVIDGLLSWLVNRDREPLRSGTTRATKLGTKNFPYFATPNTELQTVTDRIDLNAAPDKVWALIGDFGGSWHPLIANVRLIGSGIGQLRVIDTIDGKQIIERLDAIDNSARFYRYTSISGIPASDYTGRLEVKPNSAGSSVEWGAQYLPKGQGDVVVRTIVSTLFKTGLESLKSRF